MKRENLFSIASFWFRDFENYKCVVSSPIIIPNVLAALCSARQPFEGRVDPAPFIYSHFFVIFRF
jgi:hypothetical protein